MAQHVPTTSEGEDGTVTLETTPSQSISLKAFLSRALASNADTIHNDLAQMGITTVDALMFIDETDLNTLCNELNLSFPIKIQFKSAIRKLQKQKQHTTPRTVADASPKMEQMMNKINIAIQQQSNDVRQILKRCVESS
eukprot:235902_1